ncbi:unnamed protein product [Orchesella dallaii]|uniref:WD repeat-containing protein 27 n=1 Tax=Orchesella dallaii TaxID=48710 RepID=A0ABP1QEZ9_9HEXA
MMKFGSLTGYDQLVLSSTTGSEELDSASYEGNKWMKQKREQFHSDIPKILVTQRHLFAAFQNVLIIQDTKPLSNVCEGVFLTRKEFRLDNHSSPINCFGFEEETLLLCSCSDDHVFLSKWDVLLGHWDIKAISEDDGRILSCSISFKGLAIYLALFKSDTLLVYKVVSAHHPTERGPLILDSIECFASLEKVKELTFWSKSLFIQNNMYVVGVASGNTVSIKLWQVTAKQEENQIKLINHRMVSQMKTAVGADLIYDINTWFMLIFGADGVSEVFSISEESLTLIYRFKIEEPLESATQTMLGSNNSLNTTMTGFQMESRVLCAHFFPVKLSEPAVVDISKNSTEYNMGGDGDAKVCAPFHELEKLSDAEKESFFGKDPQDRNLGSTICPKLLIAAATTKGVTVIDVVSGRVEMSISFGELLKDDTIIIQYAQMSVDVDSKEIILGLQSCLTRIVFSRRFNVNVDDAASDGNETIHSEYASLIPSQPLSSKSVLRKKIKSPPRQPIAYPIIKCSKSKSSLSRSSGNAPAWARSRSRPQLKVSSSRTKVTPPLSARSQSSVSGSCRSLLNVDSESLTARITHIPTNGTYENEDLFFHEYQRLSLSSSFSHGMSMIRIASTNSGKHLAFGGNLSPLVITKTKPFQNYRIYKNVGKVSNIHFNFAGNLMLIASTDCRTTLVDWQNSKELLSLEFSTKFNEHIHSQFYFMDKFIIQPEENKVVLYSYAKRNNGYIKLKAGEFQLSGQSITALGAVNQFYSNMIISGLSNKTIQVFDTNAETVSLTIPNAHSKPISCIRINEAPKGQHANYLCDIFMTSSFSNVDPIKLWDIRSAKCIMRISDVNQATFVPTSRPNISPCGRYIVSGFEDCSVNFYDVRKVTNRLHSFKKLGSTVLDCLFDTNFPMVWTGCRNGSIMNFHIP